MSPPRTPEPPEDPHPTPPARELLASALQRQQDVLDRIEARLRSLEREISRAAQERDQHRETVAQVTADARAQWVAIRDGVSRILALTEAEATRVTATTAAEADARRHSAAWWDRLLATASSGPVLALVSPLVTLLLGALGLWLGLPILPQQPPVPALPVVAPAATAPEAP